MKKKIGLIVLILTLIGMIAVVGCTPITPEKFSGKELGIVAEGKITQITAILYNGDRSDAYILDDSDEQFLDIEQSASQWMNEITYTQTKNPSEVGVKRAIKFKYEDGGELFFLYYSSKFNTSPRYHIIDGIYYEIDWKNVNYEELFISIIERGKEVLL